MAKEELGSRDWDQRFGVPEIVLSWKGGCLFKEINWSFSTEVYL